MGGWEVKVVLESFHYRNEGIKEIFYSPMGMDRRELDSGSVASPSTLDRLQLTLASWSKRPKSSLRRRTSSCAEHCDDSTVNPTISAKRMLQRKEEGGE